MKSKFSKKTIIICLVVIVFLVALILFLCSIFSESSNPFGNRCDEAVNYKIGNKKIKKIVNKFKEIEEVKDVDVYTKLCTIKIIVNLKSDVDLELIKTKAKETLEIFDEDELALYDFALYVTSDNKESEVYPINVSKHSSRDDFAW